MDAIGEGTQPDICEQNGDGEHQRKDENLLGRPAHRRQPNTRSFQGISRWEKRRLFRDISYKQIENVAPPRENLVRS